MLKVSKLADYAIIILASLASHRNDEPKSVSIIAKESRLPEPTVSKVLKLLAKEEIVRSIRGMQGGYILVNAPENIKIIEIINAIEGPVALTACVEGAKQECDFELQCPIKGRWDQVNTAIKQALENVKLVDMLALPSQSKTRAI